MITKKINDIDTEKLSVVIEFYCVVPREEYDLGTLRLKQGDKDLILDAVFSYSRSDDENNATTMTAILKFDDSIDDSFKNNLTMEDLYQPFDSATFFIGDSYEVEPESITLFVVDNGNTKAINLTEE